MKLYPLIKTVFFVSIIFFSGCQQKQDTKPNIIIFFSDELAPEYVGAYGGKMPTPNLDRLAANGIKFENTYVVAPMCTPSRFAILTGKYPGRCIHPDFLGTYPEDQPYVIAWNTYLEGTLPTLPGILSENGYFTGMTGKWHIGKIGEDIDLPDFTEDADLDDLNINIKLQLHQEIVKNEVKKTAGFDFAESVLWGNYDNFVVNQLRYHNFPWITYGAIELLEAAKKVGKPFFLYVATTAVHGPGHAETFNQDLRYTLEGKVDGVMEYALLADSMKAVLENLPPPVRHKYAGMACLDNHIKHVMNKLEELEMDKNTIVLFMADHNVEPGKATCYKKGLHVPFILHWPGKFDQGSTTDQLVSSVDILPTILEMADVPLPEGSKFDGISFLPSLNNQSITSRPHVYAESGLARSVADGRWKYITFRYPEGVIRQMQSGEINYAPNYLNLEKQAHSSIAMEHFPGYFDADQLYDLENDPYEQENLAYQSEYSEKLRKMQDILSAYLVTFDHAYSISDTSFMRSEKFQELVDQSLSYGTDYIPWLKRDHGSIIWPPK